MKKWMCVLVAVFVFSGCEDMKMDKKVAQQQVFLE